MKKKNIIIAIIVVLLIVVIALILGHSKKPKDVVNTTIENNQAKNDISIQDIEIKDITKVYDSGITTIRANMYNTTNEVKNVTVKIILKDAQGNELKNMVQVVENLQPNRVKVLSTGLAGDYSNVNDVEFQIINQQ